MRVAVIVSTFPKLSETFILNQITGLRKRGHKIIIFSRFRPNESILHPDVDINNLLKETRYFIQIPESKWRCRIKAAIWIVLSFFRIPGDVIRTLRYLLSRRRSFSYPILFMALEVFRARPDVIHVHYGHNGNLLVPLKRIKPTLPFLAMFHGHDVRLGTEGGPAFYTDLFATADLILVNSQHTRRALLDQGAEPQKTRVHSVGIELSKFPFRSGLPKRESPCFRILTVSRLHEDKGVTDAIYAVSQLVSNFPSETIEYRIAGNGPLQEPLRLLVRELGLSSQVTFLGAMDQSAVSSQMQEADIFLLTSIHEGLGMVLLEAQAVGLPIVATETGGIPEAVVPGRSALLVPPQDPQAAAAALAECLRDPEKRIQMGKAGREHVEKQFDVEILNDKLADLYKQLRQDKT
jgi:colanic acid/amylovoran biosynthesis glycosyltransferase